MRSVLLRSAAVAVPVAGVCVASTSPGFRRTCEFWSTLAPFLVEFQAIKARARLEGCEGTIHRLNPLFGILRLHPRRGVGMRVAGDQAGETESVVARTHLVIKAAAWEGDLGPAMT